MSVGSFFITNSHIIYELSGFGYPNFFFYSKNDGNVKFLNIADELKSNLTRALHMTSVVSVYGDWLILNYNAGMLLKKVAHYKKEFGDIWAGAPDHVREFDKKLLESLHDEDNDILVFAKLKEHFD